MGEVVVVERCLTPNGEIQLQRRGINYEIISNGTFLMATYNGESEKLLVKSALEASKDPRKVLIGGLGVGFSLAEALCDPRIEHATVIEIEMKIIEWNRSYLAKFTDQAIDHPKTIMVHADLVLWIFERDIERDIENRFDVICLDIDNGP